MVVAEGKESCTVTKAYADIIIDNNGSLRDLVDRVTALCRCLAHF